jgi:hypothetical protein
MPMLPVPAPVLTRFDAILEGNNSGHFPIFLDGLTFRHRKRLAAFSILFNQSDYRINKHFRITEPRFNVCFLERDKNFIITFLPSFVKGVINDRRLFRNNADLDKMMVEKRTQTGMF